MAAVAPPAAAAAAAAAKFSVLCGMVLLTTLVSVQGEARLSCPRQGWFLYGAHCYKVHSIRLSWYGALEVCRTDGADLARIEDKFTNKYLGDLASNTYNVKDYWIGMNRRGVNESNPTESKWSDNTVTSITHGFWDVLNPDLQAGKCVYVVETNGQYRWKLGICESKEHFICSLPACAEGSFQCSSGECVQSSRVCDDYSDCSDGSDEIECAPYRMYIEGSSGIIESPVVGGTYPINSDYQWTIEGPVGSNIKLKVLHLDIQEDELMIMGGGRTTSTSTRLARLSGADPPSAEIFSYNNFMIIRFISDESVQGTGFNLSWTAVESSIPHAGKVLLASDSWASFSAPFRSAAYLCSQETLWIIKSVYPRKIITLQRDYMDLAPGDVIDIRDGHDASAPHLAQYRGTTGPRYVLSTGPFLYILLKTGKNTNVQNQGFAFKYLSGCQVDLTERTGEIFSPGYGIANYADYVICTYTIRSSVRTKLRFDPSYGIEYEEDKLKVFLGSNENGKAQHSEADGGYMGADPPQPVLANDGLIFVVFQTNAVDNDIGWKAVFSNSCTQPVFTPETIRTPAGDPYDYGDTFNVSCQPGYVFGSLEFYTKQADGSMKSKDVVSMTCGLGGVWNVLDYPECVRRYCGQPPEIADGYVKKTDGVVYGSKATYACRLSHTLVGAVEITCQEDGTWGSPPVCEVVYCPSINTSIDGGSSQLVEGNSTEAGSTYQFQCDSGYRLSGSPIVHCNSSGQWSSAVPTCSKIKCLVPSLLNGDVIVPGPKTDLVEFDEVLTVQCKSSGYELKGSPTITCQADHTFTSLPECKDKDECSNKPCPANSECTNTEGSYYCSCLPGFENSTNQCVDIEECKVDNGGCSGTCENTNGSYVCSCPPGYSLFTHNGTMGFNIPQNETGVRFGETYHINHTCVPNQCNEEITNITNGYVPEKRMQYNYKDTVSFGCFNGYILKGEVTLHCQADGNWSAERPTCEVAMCPPDELPKNLLNAPKSIVPSGKVMPGETVTITCNLSGVTEYTKTRTCRFDPGEQVYRLQGDSYECGVIDCGPPILPPGGRADPPPVTTTYGSQFVFSCGYLYDLVGLNNIGSHNVTCAADYSWTFLDLICIKRQCPHPGVPAGGSVTLQGGKFDYYDNATFHCDRNGFKPEIESVRCGVNENGTGLSWGKPTPACIDVDPPAFLGCPTSSVKVTRFSSAGFTVPVPTDNSGSVSEVIVTPYHFQPTMVITEDMTVNYTAVDHAGLTAECIIDIVALEFTPPILQCPGETIETLSKVQGGSILFYPSSANVTYNSSDAVLTFDPAGPLNFSYDDVGKHYVITVTATDQAGNNASCQYQVSVQGALCEPNTLKSTNTDSASCSDLSNGGHLCTLRCQNGFYFYDDIEYINPTCQPGQAWVPSYIPSCTESAPVEYNMKAELQYGASPGAPLTEVCQGSYNASMLDLLRTSNFKTDSCSQVTTITDVTYNEGSLVSTYDSNSQLIKFEFSFQLSPPFTPQEDDSQYIQCASLISFDLREIQNSGILAAEWRTLSGSSSCPSVSIQGSNPVTSNYRSCASDYRQRETNGATVCLPCPPGTSKNPNSGECELCPVGQYWVEDLPPRYGRCIDCSRGRLTNTEGSIGEDSCFDLCDGNFVSETGLPPCRECTGNSFAVNGTNCHPCPSGTLALRRENPLVADCEKKNCTYERNPGKLNTGDPVQHYNSITLQMCKDLCDQWGNLPGHFSECVGFNYETSTGECFLFDKKLVVTSSGSIEYNDRLCEPRSLEDCFCARKCPAGKYSSTGHEPDCLPCPAGFINNNEGATSCQECPNGQTSLIEFGTSCFDASYLCGNCKNSVACTVPFHEAVCTCLPGWTGRYCDTILNSCDSSPCYNNGNCIDFDQGFVCQCPSGFRGDRCEENIDDCTPESCGGHGTCIDGVNSFTCDCVDYYGGTRCENQLLTGCDLIPCGNNSDCVHVHDYNRNCECHPGYMGPRCETEINECESEPCQNGGSCVDLLNRFECLCHSGFTGDLCQHPNKSCHSNPCGPVMHCIDDLLTGLPKCICEHGYTQGKICQYSFSIKASATGSVLLVKPSTASAQCRELCDTRGDECEAFLHDPTTNSCTLYSTAGSMVSGGTSSLSIKTCSYPREDYFHTEWFNTVDATRNGTDHESFDVIQELGMTVCENTEPVGVECRQVSSKAAIPAYATCDQSGLMCSPSAGACPDMEIRFRCARSRVFEGKKCSVRDICSEGHKCQDGICITDPRDIKGYRCDCKPGSTGDLCQLTTDKCANQPCLNNGRCIDGNVSFTCECPKGFKGERCELNPNECDANTCDSVGTQACVDGLDEYTCVCHDGYTGPNCSINFDDCWSHPCLHGASCVDLVDGYRCECLDGFAGSRCEGVVDGCDSNPCFFDGNCVTHLNEFTCRCPAGTFGSRCQNKPSVSQCQFNNPCVNTDLCRLIGTKAVCNCSAGTTGQGCEVDIDYSCGSIKCQNGAICRETSASHECVCPPGYSGALCDVDIDECATKSCPTAATCVDGINEAFCRCQLGKAQPFCLSDIDEDYDMCFSSSLAAAGAALPFTLQVSQLQGFTIMMWVRFEQSGGTGTFFTLYTMSSRSLASQRTEAIRLNESGMYVNLAPFGKRTLSFRYFPINDGLWHLVVIFWNSATGNLDLTVDYLRQDSASSFGTLQRLTANLWIVLGGQRDAPPSSASFQGCLSDVEILSYGLDFDNDLPDLQKGHSRYTGDILRWAEFEDYGNTLFVRPSEARLVNCLAFPSEPLCINRNKVKPTVPEVTFCPEDITVATIYNDAYATWTEPTFSSGVVSVDFSQPSGSLFRRGFTEVVYIAQDEEGNTAVCTFSVFVGDAICPVPDPPRGGGAQSCQNRTDAFNYCSVSCPISNQSLVEDVPEYYTCGPSGSWDTLQDQDGIFPTCGRIVGPARADVSIYLPYNINTGVCSTITQSIVTKGQEELANLFQDWGGQLCRSADCSDITPIVNCSDLGSTTVNITLTDVSTVLQNGNEKRTVEEVWLIAVLDDKDFTFDTIIPRASLLEQQFTVEVIYFCEEGQVVRDNLCVECGPGTFYNSSTKECDNCPVGQHMAGYAALSCTPCPDGKTTRAMGSTGSDECEENCLAGSYFNDSGCVECPVAFYQDQPGQFECTPCPRGLLTLTAGSTSVNSCADPCDSGFELLVNGTCVPCSQGTYRQSGLNQTCLPCPSAYTTPSVGSTSASNCTVLRCPVGSRANENQTACELCPVGTYQPLLNQRDCLPCSTNFTTANRGSSDASECKQFCPSGYEVEAGQCVACPIATYKDNSKDPLSLCLPCDFGYLTPSDTSISESNCSIRNCSAGFFIQRDPLGVETCVPCPVDQYNPQPYQYTCLPCPPGNGTRKSGADRESMCEDVCDSGEEVVNGVCTPCPQGYYKNNSDDRFAQCSLCPTEFITATTGAVSSDLCNIRNCSAGYYREVSNNTCMKCPMNTYQPDKWQTSCVDCPPEHLTRSTGASRKDQCLLSCNPGRQDQNDTCTDCPVGFYKNTTGVAGCVACPTGFRTADTGSTDEANCSVVACDPGTYLDSAQNICEPCPYGQYQPSKWQDSCVPCPAGKTTFMEGASSMTQCFRDCAKGRELDLATDECEACKRGYYRDKSSPNQTACVLCPSNFITPGIGTDLASDCRIANCTVPGYYLNTGANKCEECPVGSYNSMWWAESCTPCVPGYTTKTTGLATEDSCYRDCPSGQQVNEITNVCSVCERGKFRDKDQTWTCQPCPTPFTTPAAGATSVSNCTVPTCAQGSYYSDQQSVCMPCPPGTYQPESGMRRCLDCPDHGSTLTEGCVSNSDCIPLCDPRLRLNNCSANAECSVSSDGDLQCTCNSFFQGDGYSCTHVCDLQEPYCRNGGTCYKNRGNPCVCREYYSGPQCQQRADPSKTPNDTEIIVIVCILVGALLCVIILIIIAIVRRRQREVIKDKESDSTSNNQSGTPSGIIPRFNTKAYMLEDPAYYNAKQSNRAVSSLYYDNATYSYSEETT